MGLQINSAVSCDTLPGAGPSASDSGCLQAILAAEYSTRAGGKTWSATVERMVLEHKERPGSWPSPLNPSIRSVS